LITCGYISKQTQPCPHPLKSSSVFACDGRAHAHTRTHALYGLKMTCAKSFQHNLLSSRTSSTNPTTSCNICAYSSHPNLQADKRQSAPTGRQRAADVGSGEVPTAANIMYVPALLRGCHFQFGSLATITKFAQALRRPDDDPKAQPKARHRD
jgi:hypothetical protein